MNETLLLAEDILTLMKQSNIQHFDSAYICTGNANDKDHQVIIYGGIHLGAYYKIYIYEDICVFYKGPKSGHPDINISYDYIQCISMYSVHSKYIAFEYSDPNFPNNLIEAIKSFI